MKKLELIVIGIIIILAIACIFKGIKDPKSTTKVLEPTNPFIKISYYNEDYLERYNAYKEKTSYSDEQVVLYVNIGLDQEFYTNIKDSTNLNTNYILVNKYNSLSKNYIPKDLVKLSEFAKSGIYLNQEAYEAFKLMARDAKISGFNIRIISAYRSYDYQENLYNKYLKKDSRKNVDTYSARAGHSEHQTGLAVDIDNLKTSYTSFENTKEYSWMLDNCYKYGFILRYPKDKEFITGYMYEPWHYRYVGHDISKYIYENNLTYEEYYYQFIDE